MLKKRLLSNRKTGPVITAPFPFIHLSNTHSLHLDPSLTHLTPSSPCHLPSFAVCLPLSALPSVPISICLFPSSFQLTLPSPPSSTLSVSASLSAHASSNFSGNEPPLWRQRKAPFITIFLATLFPNPSSCVFFFSPKRSTSHYGHDDAQLLWQIGCSLVCKLPVVVSPGELVSHQAVI